MIDLRTKQPVGKPLATRKAARLKADRLDLEYGAVRYGVFATDMWLATVELLSN